MCFSAAASFGAAIALTSIGAITYKKAGSFPLRALALIPLLFGIQQFMEGVVWIASSYDSFAGLKKLSTYGFILFAWVIWPIYIPYAFLKNEKPGIRKVGLRATGFLGILVVSVLIYILLSRGVEARIVDCSILYHFDFEHALSWIFSLSYVTAVVLPTLLSRMPFSWMLGIVNIITFSISKIYFANHVISVWCFFAAISSIILFHIITKEKSKVKTIG